MCGRYVLKTSAIKVSEELGLAPDPQLEFEARYNLAPLQAAPVVLDAAPTRLTVGQWGLLPFWAKDARLASKLINARAETLASKPAFKGLVATHRCLVPCDGFYEWEHHGAQRTPHYIHRGDGRLLTMAGLWSLWTSPDGLEVTTFTIITTHANGFMRRLHERMPVFLDGAARDAWLTKACPPETLLVPWAGPALVEHQVEARVNAVGSEGPQCLEPAKVVQLSLL